MQYPQQVSTSIFAALTCKVVMQQAATFCIMMVLRGIELVNRIQYAVIFKCRTNNSKAYIKIADNSLSSAQKIRCSDSASGTV
jgi:hypothetical protein